MKATALLTAQHREVRALFERIEKGKTKSEKTKLFEELAANLVAHDAIEREIFYPACEKEMGPTKLLGEALVEHGVIEFSLYVADEARGEDDFDHKVQVLQEMVEHHVEEEEKEFFPKAEKALGFERLTELGAEMKLRFEEVKGHDFRRPLHHSLQLVLGGVTKAGAGNGGKAAIPRKPAKQARGAV